MLYRNILTFIQKIPAHTAVIISGISRLRTVCLLLILKLPHIIRMLTVIFPYLYILIYVRIILCIVTHIFCGGFIPVSKRKCKICIFILPFPSFRKWYFSHSADGVLHILCSIRSVRRKHLLRISDTHGKIKAHTYSTVIGINDPITKLQIRQLIIGAFQLIKNIRSALSGFCLFFCQLHDLLNLSGIKIRKHFRIQKVNIFLC